MRRPEHHGFLEIHIANSLHGRCLGISRRCTGAVATLTDTTQVSVENSDAYLTDDTLGVRSESDYEVVIANIHAGTSRRAKCTGRWSVRDGRSRGKARISTADIAVVGAHNRIGGSPVALKPRSAATETTSAERLRFRYSTSFGLTPGG